MKIAEGLSHKPNFINYTYRDEMVADGIENCLMYFENFDVEKSSNAFAYFTQIVYYAFLRRIQKEKKQMYVKYKSTENFAILEETDLLGFDEINTKPFELYDNISEFIETFEETKKKKRAIKKEKGIEKFLE
jgi:DNA-directed RNA polymerase specialized sigma24 family protein